MEFSAAVEYVLRREGVDILSHPTRFLGYMLDCADLDTTEMIVLERNCDEQLLEPYLRAARAGGPMSLEAAAKNVAANLTRNRMISADASEKMADGIAQGIARAMGMAYQPVKAAPTPAPAQPAAPAPIPTPAPAQPAAPAATPTPMPNPTPQSTPWPKPTSQPAPKTVPVQGATPKPTPKPAPKPSQTSSPAVKTQPVAKSAQPAKRGGNPLLWLLVLVTAASLWYWKFPRDIGPLHDATPLHLKIMSSSLEGSAIITAKGVYEDETIGPKYALLVEYRPPSTSSGSIVDQRYVVDSSFHEKTGDSEVVYECYWDSGDSVIEFGFPDINDWSDFGVFEGSIEVTRIDSAGHETVGLPHEWNVDINNWLASLYGKVADFVWGLGIIIP